MEEGKPHIAVRAIHSNDAPWLFELDYLSETDRIYAVLTDNRLQSNDERGLTGTKPRSSFMLELMEMPIDPPIYQSYRGRKNDLNEITYELQQCQGGFCALVDETIAGGIWMTIDEQRSLTIIKGMIVGRNYRRYALDRLLFDCSLDWSRHQKCHGMATQLQNSNYPAIQFCLRYGMEIWTIDRSAEHVVNILLGRHL
ncbi:GNAT family N-acetyltransferase [Tengunoibacter tsumagoiensis]|uniref:N-acetyltransferase domain-containing protein n=1 Tax=Tengunoibacter tsumagoiensis TaxID=2014871 RepID=A0A402A287_9CHLR|nr:GNAT family N-acetyltransferase [Tengunoibacter tsumagoiensis]GCE13169.1 hypothetical protein KTT_30280 [Tengunoibacter tsumagoiensis]